MTGKTQDMQYGIKIFCITNSITLAWTEDHPPVGDLSDINYLNILYSTVIIIDDAKQMNLNTI